MKNPFQRVLTLLGAGLCAAVLAGAVPNAPATPKKGGIKPMELKSSAFENGAVIPERHACRGTDISPSLSWSGAPKGTKSFALIMDDPDAPPGVWVHWVVYAIPPTATRLPEEVPHIAVLPDGTKQGVSGGVSRFSELGYGGPCPPPGPAHRYVFKIYALDVKLGLPPKATKFQVEEAMKGHILARGELVGLYQR